MVVDIDLAASNNRVISVYASIFLKSVVSEKENFYTGLNTLYIRKTHKKTLVL